MRTFAHWMTLTAAATLLAASAANAKIYRWVDDNGTVQYTQQAPNDRSFEDVSKGYRQKHSEQNESSDEPKNEIDTEISRLQKVKQQNCEISKKNLQMFQDEGVTRVIGTDGNPVELTESEREKRISAAQANIDKYCAE